MCHLYEVKACSILGSEVSLKSVVDVFDHILEVGVIGVDGFGLICDLAGGIEIFGLHSLTTGAVGGFEFVELGGADAEELLAAFFRVS